jgi:hypothetical protein
VFGLILNTPFLAQDMAYKLIKGYEAKRVGAKISDGTKVFNGLLGDATQEELEELHLIGIKGIIIVKSKKRKPKKTRDNNPTEPKPLPPETNE